MKRTSPEIEQKVLNLILLGYAYSDIAANTGVAVPTVKKIKARNKPRYETVETEFKQWTTENAKASLRRAYKLLNLYLDEGLAGAREISTKELVLIANQMLIHEQTIKICDSSEPHFKKQKDLDKLLFKLKKK